MSAVISVRVMVPDVWDEVSLELPAATSFGELKRLALARSRVMRDPAGYVVKYRGAEQQDEAQTLAAAGVVPNAPLIVLPRRRRPLR
ncbi:MAG TPA: hypothetical protein VFK09_01020 [Gemmatimonadales bacterium]|jgi:hypothetical protein|nr:hypothetical protein [Gemmatimonadales bacterium]